MSPLCEIPTCIQYKNRAHQRLLNFRLSVRRFGSGRRKVWCKPLWRTQPQIEMQGCAALLPRFGDLQASRIEKSVWKERKHVSGEDLSWYKPGHQLAKSYGRLSYCMCQPLQGHHISDLQSKFSVIEGPR